MDRTALSEAAILWRRLDRPGHEYAELRAQPLAWLLSGVAVFEHDKHPCRLDFAITCDEGWANNPPS